VTDVATRVGGPGDRSLFIELWGEFLREHHKRGNYIEPTVRSMDYFLTLFEQYTTGIRGGVVVFGVDGKSVCMWGDAMAEGIYDHADGRVAHGLGTYVRPESRRKNIAHQLWRRAGKILKNKGFDAVIGSVNIKPKDINIDGHIGLERADSFGFIPTQVVGVLRL